MYILHSGMYKGLPVLWAEDGNQSVLRAYSGFMGKTNLAAGPAQLRAILEPVGIKPKKIMRVTIHLPTARGKPVPSDESLYGAASVPAKTGTITIVPWVVNVAVLDTADLVLLMGRVSGERVLLRGVLVGADMAYMADLMRLAGSLVARQQYLPAVADNYGQYTAVWQPILTGADSDHFDSLLSRMPGAILCFTHDETSVPGDTLYNILFDILASLLGMIIRSATHDTAGKRGRKEFDSIHDSWLHGLRSTRTTIAASDAPQLLEQIHEWHRPVMAAAGMPLRFCFRLEAPQSNKGRWFIRYLLQSRDDPSLLVPAKNAWTSGSKLFPENTDVREFILISLGYASVIFPHIASTVAGRNKSGIDGSVIDVQTAYEFLTRYAQALGQAGYGIILPSWWTGRGTRARLRARARVAQPRMKSSGMFSLASVVEFDWKLALGDRGISMGDLEALANAKAPLVNMRGEWVEVSPTEIQKAVKFLSRRSKKAPLLDVIKMGMGNVSGIGPDADSLKDMDVDVSSSSRQISDILDGMSDRTRLNKMRQPDGFAGTLRPYQQQGFSWMWFLQSWGLGGCLADDMGLGKTIQTLALMQQYKNQNDPDCRDPFLLICPTSVISNWHREAGRFAPDMSVMIHHGTDRYRTAATFRKKASRYDIVVSSYGLLHRDIDIIKKTKWAGVILDEAQNIKNPQTKQARAARMIDARCRFALTGTPVENNVGDLWSVMDFLNPGFLGNHEQFRRNFFVPIQARQDEYAAEKLRQATGPFILRRLKTDKTIIPDLPEKIETKTYCNLTKEQVSLYGATLKALYASLDRLDGIARKGMILATLTKLKQVCDHPVVLLKDNSGITASKKGKKDVIQTRSGKLSRLIEMLTEVIQAGDRALVFTQFVEMGHMLRRHIHETFGHEVLFLHGGTSRKRRDQMVQQFQDAGTTGPHILVISIKAGGTGLNLTAANHVFHFDRWWNPAVEDQATDRAFRIGQKKNVQVHKMICSGTLEEKIDTMIENKKTISKKVVGTGEAWLTEMSNEDLRKMLELSADAGMMEEDR